MHFNIYDVFYSQCSHQHVSAGIRVDYFYSKTNYMHQCIKFILFWNDTPHVSDGLSVHHQDFKTVHSATGICQILLSDKRLLLYV